MGLLVPFVAGTPYGLKIPEKDVSDIDDKGCCNKSAGDDCCFDGVQAVHLKLSS